jgi:hypothetical protein
MPFSFRRLVSARWRAVYVLTLVLTLTALAAGNPGWVGPVLAQTVPTVTKSPTAGPPPVTASPRPPTAASPTATPPKATAAPSATAADPEATEAAAAPSPALPVTCGAAPRNLPAFSPSQRTWYSLHADRFTLLVTQRQLTTAALCWITLDSAASAALPALPAAQVAVGRGVRLAALGQGAQPLATPVRGLLVCFELRPRDIRGAALHMAGLGLPSAPRGWTLLPTRLMGGRACAPVPALPATLMLVAGDAP